MEKLKHFSLFSGIESFKKALTNLGIDNELVGYSEFDKYASVALSAIHGVSEDLNYGDITKIDETKLPDCDLITYGFPCQDISVAGLGKGIIEGETRSGLLHDALRIIKYKMPKYAIAENVKNLVGKRFKKDFDALLEELEGYGYNNYWQVLNAKDYGIPQNRERVFVVSIRKDIDNGSFEFPKGFDSGLRLKDLLLDEVEDKYYIENDRTDNLLQKLTLDKKVIGNVNPSGNGMNGNVYNSEKPSPTITTNKGEGIKCIVASRGRNPNNPSDRTVGSPTEQRLEPNTQGITNTLTTVQKDNLVLEKSILRYERTEYGKEIRKQYESGEIVEKIGNMRELKPREDGIANTLTTVQKDNLVLEPSNELKLFTNLKGGKWDKIHESARRVYDEEGIAPTIPTCGGGNIEPKVAVREATKLGYAIATVGDSINLEQPNSKTRRGRVGKEVAQTLTTSCNQATLVSRCKVNELKTYPRQNIYQNTFGTLGTNCGSATSAGGGSVIDTNYKIRKLTPKECWRLMGFTDEDYRKARQALEDRFYNGKDRSNSQMYKMVGNSIVVDVLEGVLKNLIN